ncbi:flavin-binding monooxygenase-like family protein [Ophiocordyceps camponoti-floridani]|uniref:Flavin-binding monooxygenase-like family protein n=1 Tax=Ophiocordyceps camponoti-floridani TaxID=2030778 RepID=A0A8H4Q8G5_9HYPO|nr:flavin-binding monooxygenase-like family protein [Ophiocordyceps camponoti-floridani]
MTASTDTPANGLDMEHITGRYLEEKKKRLRPDGNAQYVDLSLASSPRLRDLVRDPFVDDAALNGQPATLSDGDEIRVLILGAGFGGLLFGVRLVEAGFPAESIRLVDPAGGFGGTWYWNRYPGIMCDIESALYMPLLEEMGYMPKHRYAYGPELRRHAEAVAARWRLQGVFRTRCMSLDWEEGRSRWQVKLRQSRGPETPAVEMKVRAQFVVLAHGVLNHPKAPRIPGLADFRGKMMHTGRWDYAVSGGSADDLALTGLRGKRVGVIGTGATAVQLVPEVARWAEEVLVFQRTPSAVDVRGQRETDREAWGTMTGKSGWWRARNDRWNRVMSGFSGMDGGGFDDAWAGITGYRHVVGGPHPAPISMEAVPKLVAGALEKDAPRMERLRRRVDEVVTGDEEAAARLKAWYPSWCKRPCFHDEYLEAFNLSHVSLVDTSPPLGIQRFTERGAVVADVEYPLDVLVLATGYRAPFTDLADPGGMASGVNISGRGGVDFSSRWKENGPCTLHGMFAPGFPNLVLSGPCQTGMSANYVYHQDNMASHAAHVLSAARRSAPEPEKVTVEAGEVAAMAWTGEVASRAAWMAPMGFCGPSYLNNEGEAADPVLMAKAATYGLGITAFEQLLARWRAEGRCRGWRLVVGERGLKRNGS